MSSRVMSSSKIRRGRAVVSNLSTPPPHSAAAAAAVATAPTSTAVVANTRGKDGNCRLSSQPRGGIAAAGYEHPSFLGIFADCQHTLVSCT